MIDTIIIPVLNRYDLLDRCVATIGEARTLVVIDNGNCLDDNGMFWKHDGLLRGVDRVVVIPSLTNLGVATSWNLGIKMTPESNGWLLLNSDAHFGSDAFNQLAGEVAPDRIVLAGDPPWCCAWIGSDVVRRVGLFCERFYPAYMEDLDYERRARICGIDVVRSDANVFHDNSSTIASNETLAALNRKTHAANMAFFNHRWANVESDGLPATHEWSLTTRLAQSW